MTRADGTHGDTGAGSDPGTGPGDGPGTERTFAALPPARGRAFARTWWGARWLKALEDSALDAEQLRRGRRLARQGAVGAVSVRPGGITAVVRGADGTAHRADVLLLEFTDAEWERLLEVAGREAGHAAALLDRDMPPRLVEDAESAGVELLPGIGDLDATCDCGAWDHCPHTAALCYQTGRLLDEDPFVLLLLRGRTEGRFLAGLGMHDAERGTADTAADGTEGRDSGGAADGQPGLPTRPGAAGIEAGEAFALGEILPPLPAVPEPVTEAGQALTLEGGAPPAPPGLDLGALEFLASDAAARARLMLQDALGHPHAAGALPVPLTPRQDAVRLAASRPGERITQRLARGCGLTPEQLRSAVRAWEAGGTEGLSVWDEPWSLDEETLARARARIAAALAEAEPTTGTEPDRGPSAAHREPSGLARLHVVDNRWSTPGGAVQLRYGRDGRWWPYRRDEQGTWWPSGGPEQDPAAALAVAAGDDEPGRDERA
ncbi:SWIM zinc finger family protein [Streptomyces winkii]|uniref:SWIM zinc finger family protein n=1 Tax=Streptomyces winkii TaxID=3051178 RepID=UPI0028D5976A|nr:SWF or SNF family helicase [Streptomyces sp. DSM 40971]